MRLPEMGPGAEFDLIRSFLEAGSRSARQTRADRGEAPWGAPDASARVGPGDDAAVLEVGAHQKLVLSVDTAVEEVHFRRAWLRWSTVGYRATVAALSDLAAMAARPLGVLVAASLPPELGAEVLDEIAVGVGRCLGRCGGDLLGGDLSRSPGPVALSVTAAGEAERPVGRSGAAAGDEVWVTGRLGGAAAATAAWLRELEPDPRARRAFEAPVARTQEARWLVDRADVTALIDVSDGLAGDAGHVSAASGARLRLELPRVPLAEVLEEYEDRSAALQLALGGGEDFELLLAAPEGALEPLRDPFGERFGTPLTRIGRVERGSGVAWLGAEGREVSPPASGGYDHFAGEPPPAPGAGPASGDGDDGGPGSATPSGGGQG